MQRLFIGILIVAGIVMIRGSVSESKTPSWQPGEHPRLIVTAAEKPALQAKLNAPNTISNAIWTDFLTSNRTNNTIDYADGAVLYWLADNTTAGQTAISHAESLMAAFPNGLNANSGGFDINFWRYRDMLLTYDLAYNLLTPTQRQAWLEYMVLQAGDCLDATPGYTPGNIHMKFVLCAYASAVLLEGEGVTITVTDEVITRSNTPNTADTLRFALDASNFVIADTPGQTISQYALGADFTYSWSQGVCSRCINWAPGGNEPAGGSTYYVSYTVTPGLSNWKSLARTALENHLSYQWSEGYYNGGLSPYGSVMAELLPYLIEIIKRDTGIDYAKNQDIKKIVDLYLYEQLPSDRGLIRRYNMINDTNGWLSGFADALTYPGGTYQSWVRPYVAWATTQYTGDPEGYDQRYVWLWTQAYRDTDGTPLAWPGTPDWREAWWINDSAFGSYPVTSAPTPDWAKQNYFRGKEVVYVQTGDWGSDDQTTALLSMVAGPHNYGNEHDQGDAGSFTFYSLNEDWAVDSGYATGSAGGQLMDHNAVGIDGGGYNPTGPHAVAGANGYFGGFANFEQVVLTDGASALQADLSGAWTLTDTPYVQYHDRYFMMVNGSQTPYLIVGDNLQQDANTHSFEWYLHNGPGNTVAINGSTARVTGVRTGATMDVHSLGPQPVTFSQTQTSNGNVGLRQRLQVQATGVTNPQFFHLLLPTAAGDVRPVVTNNSVTNGEKADVSWPDGTTDTILWRTGGTTVTGSNVISDGQLTIVRKNSSSVVTGFSVLGGRSVAVDGQPYLSVTDGTQPVSVTAFGSAIGLQGGDVSQVRITAPWASRVQLEDGETQIAATNLNGQWFVNAGLPLSEMSKGAGIRYQEDFNDGYGDNLTRFNLQQHPAEQFVITGGAYELRETGWDWPSFTKRDSTPWRRADIYPNLNPPLEHGDADYSFKFKFSDQSSATRTFRMFLRTNDRTPEDWVTNQEYLRVEFTAADAGTSTSEVTVGQRINGAWSGVSDNNKLTASLPSATGSFDDTNWHTASVRLLGDAVRVILDGQTLIDSTLSASPASGYIQMSVVGTTPVLIDDIVVQAIDQTRPVAPTAGKLIIQQNNSGVVTVSYGQGSSTDAQDLVLYESSSPIAPSHDPSSLTLIESGTNLSTLAFTNATRTDYHAVAVRDVTGNLSLLFPLSADVTAPATVTDLTTQ